MGRVEYRGGQVSFPGPAACPPGYKFVRATPDWLAYTNEEEGVNVLVSASRVGEPGMPGVWLHLSVSAPPRDPDSTLLRRAWAVFAGEIPAFRYPPNSALEGKHKKGVRHVFGRLDAPQMEAPEGLIPLAGADA